ncbi:DNA-binding protein [Actinomadura fulvescens]|uniref:DNA-binding protein n=1 Tax=Actinomadura fulvescens TaxID=46160 RepID=A0ABN3QHI0_9ACTN
MTVRASHKTLLAKLAAERHWTHPDGIACYQQTAEDMGLATTVTTRQWERWLSGELKTLPRPVRCRVLERMFNRPVHQLFQPPAAGLGIPAASRGVDHGGTEVNRDLVAGAAEESTEHVAEVEALTIGPATLEQAHDDVRRLAQRYGTTPPWEVLTHAVVARRRVRELLKRTCRPDQQRELYLLLGELCGLLAVSSFDLGDAAAATQHARAAWGYGEHIGHDGLRAWARGTQALIAYWDGRPQEAVRLAQSGQRYQATGTGRVRVCCIEARAWSHLGNRAAAQDALERADHARQHAGPGEEMHDGLGGEFGFGAARQARCEGTVYVQLGDPQYGDPRTAINRTLHALSLYDGRPSMKVIPQAHADLAAAHLLDGSFADACDHLEAALDVPVEHRIRGLIERLASVCVILDGDRYRTYRPAQDLRHDIWNFAAAPASPAITGPARAALPPATT